MTYPPQPGNWSDPSSPNYPGQPSSGAGGFGQPTSGYPGQPSQGYPGEQSPGWSGQPASGAGYPGQPSSGYPGQPSSGAGYPAPGGADNPAQPSGYPAPASGGGYPQPGAYPGADYGPAQPAYGYGYPPAAPQQKTNGMAIAALVLALVGLATCGLTAPIGAILGHVAQKQIRERGEGGEGLAKGGIIAGWVIFGLAILAWAGYIGLIIFAVKNADTTPDPYMS